jgi:hypothetical protein
MEHIYFLSILKIYMAEAFSESLAFTQVKKRAVSSRSFRTKITPSNGNTFNSGNTIDISLPANLPGQYYNFNQCYLKFKVAVGGGNDVRLDRVGAPGFIKRMQISTAGAQIYDCNNWNVLASCLMDTDSSSEWKASSGNITMGTLGDQLQGESIADGAERTYTVPMMLNPLAMTTPHRMIYAGGLSAIQFRLTLEDAAVAVQAAAGATLTFTEVELVCLMTELSPGAQAQIDSMTGGQYNILANSYINSQATLPAYAAGVSQTLNANLGVSVSSLERLIICHRPQATASLSTAFSLGNRSTAGLTQYSLLINSEKYPARDVIVGDRGAEVYSELLLADHALVDFRKGNPILNGFAAVGIANTGAGGGTSALSGVAPGYAKNNCFLVEDPAGLTAGVVADAAISTPSNVGTFQCALELESGLSDGKSSHIYSGISTISSVVQYKGDYSAVAGGAGVRAQTIDFFAQHTVMLSLDMKGSGVWSVSV